MNLIAYYPLWPVHHNISRPVYTIPIAAIMAVLHIVNHVDYAAMRAVVEHGTDGYRRGDSRRRMVMVAIIIMVMSFTTMTASTVVSSTVVSSAMVSSTVVSSTVVSSTVATGRCRSGDHRSGDRR